MKKLLLTILLTLVLSGGASAEEESFPEFSTYSLDKNINIYNWKIDKIRSTSDKDIYYLKKNNRLINCVVYFYKSDIETYCTAP